MALGRNYTAASSMYGSYAGAIGGTYPFTFACWCWLNGTGTNRCLMSVNTSGSDNQQHIIRVNTTENVLAISRTTSEGIAQTTATISTGALQHVAGVFAAGNSRSVYLNGGNKITNTTSRTPSGMNTFYIGRRSVTTMYWDGDIFIPCVWNIALTDNEILALAQGMWPGRIQRANIIGFWPGGYSDPEVDLSGQNRALTLNNSPTISNRMPQIQLPFGYDNWQVPTGFTPSAVTLRMLAATGVGK